MYRVFLEVQYIYSWIDGGEDGDGKELAFWRMGEIRDCLASYMQMTGSMW